VRIYLKGSLQNSIQTDYKQQIPTSNYDKQTTHSEQSQTNKTSIIIKTTLCKQHNTHNIMQTTKCTQHNINNPKQTTEYKQYNTNNIIQAT